MKKLCIPVITYHHVNPHQGDTVTVTPEYFEGQLKHLKNKGYQTLFLPELISRLQEEPARPEKLVALTFDDGCLDNFLYAYPILKKYNMKATIFAITSLAKEKRDSSPEILPRHSEIRPINVADKGPSEFYLSWEDMREMESSGLVDIQPHTHRHRNLVKENDDNAEKELKISKQLIEEKLSKECAYIAWPWGACKEETITIARNLGYRGGVITLPGGNLPGTDPMRIKRFDTEKGNVGWFSRKLFIYSSSRLSKIYLALKR